MSDQYFPHDYNASTDLNIAAFMSDAGIAGYGFYWIVVELLHKEKTHQLPRTQKTYKALAKQMSTSVEQVSTFVEQAIDNDLFEKNDEFIISERVLKNVKKRQEISDKRSFAGKISATKRTCVEHVLTNDEQEATNKRKRKEKNLKDKEKNIKKEIPPVPAGSMSFEEFSETFSEKFVTAQDIIFPEWVENSPLLRKRLMFYFFEFRPKTNKKLKNTGLAITKIITRMEDDSNKSADVAMVNLEHSITKSYDMIYPKPENHTPQGKEIKPFDIVDYAKDNLERFKSADASGPYGWKNALIGILQKEHQCSIEDYVDQNIESLKAITDIIEFATEIKTAVKPKEP